MALVNHIKREINAKIVYYGPERSGKATSLRYVYDRIKPELRGDLKSVPASGSSLLFFDFSPFDQAVFGGYRIRLHIYTLQGPVANPAAWKMTLKGADGLVIVTDAAEQKLAAAQQSVAQLREFLGSYGVGLDDQPVVLQLNKADLAGPVDGDSTARALGLPGCCVCATTAVSGEGVLKTLTSLSRIIMGRIGAREDLSREAGSGAAASAVEKGAGGVRPADTAGAPTVQVTTFSAPRECAPLDTAPDACVLNNALPRVVIAEGGVRVEGGSIRIPLEVSSAAGVQRLTVSVAIVPE
jgi:uncharacterized protein